MPNLNTIKIMKKNMSQTNKREIISSMCIEAFDKKY